MSDQRLSRKEVAFTGIAFLLVVVLVLSASIRHSVLCESGYVEDAEASLTLERQSLDARLLSVEQEAMENLLVVQRIIDGIDAKYSSTDRALLAIDGEAQGPVEGHPPGTLAELYTDAEKLAEEIDAAFDKIDDDVFDRRAPAADPWRSAGEWGDAGQLDDWERPPRDEVDGPLGGGGGGGASPYAPPRDAFGASLAQNLDALDDFSASREAQRKLDDAVPADDAPRGEQRCSELKAEFGIVPSVSWGSAPPDAQTEWRTLDCDTRVQ